ncbi:MAG: hypothetical protein IBJ18_10870 [Phycisphaerales bacterium]|nr:hypothetical protein [Phycisphaerales bacterium]
MSGVLNSSSHIEPAAPVERDPAEIGPIIGTQPLASARLHAFTALMGLAVAFVSGVLLLTAPSALGAVIAGSVFAFGLWLLYRFASRVNVHADFGLHGIRLRRGSRSLRTILYTDITGFAYHTRMMRFDENSELGIRMRVTARNGPGFMLKASRVAPTYRATLPPMSHLDYAREAIAGVMSRAMYEEYARTGTVAWTSRLRFEKFELVYKPMFGREKRIAIAHAVAVREEDRPIQIVENLKPRTGLFCRVSERHPRLWSGMALLVRLQVELLQTRKMTEAPKEPTG